MDPTRKEVPAEVIEASRTAEHDFGGGWNYRVLHRTIETPAGLTEDDYGVYEVYYNADGEPSACSKDPMPTGGDTLGELTHDLRLMLEALEKPVLEYSDF